MNKLGRSGERVNRRAQPLFLLTAALALPTAVAAQVDELPAADAGVSPVVVTATRYPVDAQTVGSSISVITAEDLQQQQTRFVSDILREVPGLAISRSGTFGTQTQVRIRGAEGNHTLVIIDGVKVNDPATSNEFDFGDLLASDIERMEILRGPQAILYGSNTIGGVINIITKRGTGKPTATLRAEGGSFYTFDGGSSLSGGDEQVNGFLGLSGYRTAGTNISQHGGEDDGYNNITLNSSLNAKPVENLELSGSLRYVDAELQYDDFGPDTDSRGFYIPTDADQKDDRSTLSGRAQAKLTLFDGMFENIAGYSGLRTTNYGYTNNNKNSRFNAESNTLDYQGNVFVDTPEFADASHTFTFIFERQAQSGDNFYEYSGGANFPTIINTGYAGEYRIGLWERLFLTGGARYDENNKFEDFVSPRFTGAFLIPATDSRVHASWGKGVQNPTLTELYGFFANYVGNPDLKPENSTGWDAGVEQSFLDKRVVFDVTYFNNHIRDYISSEYDPAIGRSSPINLDGTSKIHGIELSATATVYAGLTVKGAYTYTNGEDPDGNELVRRAPHVGSATINYAFLEDEKGYRRANVNINIDYNGKQKDYLYQAPTYRRYTETLDDYWLVNFAASYEVLSGLEVVWRIENIFDEDYQEVYGYNSPDIAGYAGLRGRMTF